ncbi:MAG: hypothetical protein AB1489_43440 [Acidobacteriota bacterium]
MNLSEAKEKINSVELLLDTEPFILFHTFERNGRLLYLALTDRLRKIAKKGRVWKSKAFLTVLKNAEYGFDEKYARSFGGADGIFLLDRTFTPRNEMMRKIFDRYIDKLDSGIEEVINKLDIPKDQLYAVRLVSHHMRLLGVLARKNEGDWLILVDYDDNK